MLNTKEPYVEVQKYIEGEVSRSTGKISWGGVRNEYLSCLRKRGFLQHRQQNRSGINTGSQWHTV